jgi:AraC-like DNA-binding protein
MMSLNIYQPFEIEVKELDRYIKSARRNNYFELIHVIDGTGVQYINGNKFNYRKGNLFLITPKDLHSFEIGSTTRFFFLRFNEQFIQAGKAHDVYTVQHMEFILQNASHRPGCILKNKVDKPLISSLVENILQEKLNRQIYHNKIIEQLVNTIIVIVARNIALKLPKNVKENTGEVVLDMLQYIQENIFEPEKLRAGLISKRFGISMHYLGRYFRSQTGETLQQYISNYKVRLIETRLLHSDMRINEIVSELSFTDESHLNRVFKKHKGMTPSEYRKQMLPA